MKRLNRWAYGIMITGAMGWGSAVIACPNCGDHPPRGATLELADAAVVEAPAEAKAPAKVKALKPQANCPIMPDNAIDHDLFVDHDGKRIYVCCRGCVDAVKADPDAAIAALADMGQAPGQATCVIMADMKINPDLYVDHKGQRIYVCCPGCIDRVKAAPAAAIETLRERGVVPARAKAGKKDGTQAKEHHHHKH